MYHHLTTNRTKNWYELFTDSCEQFTDGYVLLRAVYDTYGLLRVIYGKINPWTIIRRFLTCQTICLSFHGSLTVSASCDELFTDTSELLRMLATDYELAIRNDW